MCQVPANDLHVHKEILSQCMRDAPPHDEQMTRLVCNLGAGTVKGDGINLAKGQANVVDHRIGKTVQQML